MQLRDHVSIFFHRYLRIPYTLNTYEFQSPKKPRATYVLLHGIGNSLRSWDEVAALMPKDVRVIGIDLLGFGLSPKPAWAKYSARTQARSVGVTLLGLRIAQQPIIVGHSLGALVAIEVAKRYPLLPQRLVLCSPPFYKPASIDGTGNSVDDMLRWIYKTAKKHPEQLEQFSPLAVKLGLANKSLSISKDNVSSYMGALEASIINQTALQDVKKLRLPITVFYGVFDPVVIKKHIVSLAKARPNITAKRLNTAHEIVGSYVKTLGNYLADIARH